MTEPGLLLRNEASMEAWRVWPDPEPVSPGRIRETGRYIFELHGSGAGAEAVLLVDDLPLEALRPAGGAVARWRWDPGFHAGVVEAELRVPGEGVRRFEIITDPDLRKLTRDDFDTMVREILEDTFALFSLTGFRRSVARGIGAKPPPIARLEFLRSRITELEETAAAIARSPRRILTTSETILPAHRAARASGAEILRSLRSGRPLQETHGGPSRLPPALQGFLPARIRSRQRLNSLDLPEHRQMAACLRSWAAWLVATADVLARSQGEEKDAELKRSRMVWAARCRRLARRVAGLCELPPFAEAGEAPAWLQLSAVFRGDPSYRRFFRIWQDINLGISAVFGDFLSMPLARTFELYELWCFLRLVRAGAETWGTAGLDVRDLFIADTAGGVTVAAAAVTVPLGGGWQLSFQRAYREYWREADGQGSFSREMVPDIVLTSSAGAGGDPPRVIVLDAKYRIEDGMGAALGSIHTYRDALVREAAGGGLESIVTGAFLLAPHATSPAGTYQATPMPGRLFHPEYRRSFRFGAVTLRPGMTSAEVAAALHEAVAAAATP